MRLISIDDAEAGMKLAEPIFDAYGRLLLAHDTELTTDYLATLRKVGVAAIYVSDGDTSDIQVPPAVNPELRHKALRNLSEVFGSVSRGGDPIKSASVEEIRSHLRSDRFHESIKALTQEGSIQNAVRGVDAIVQDLLDRHVLLGLNSIKAHDGYTYQHSIDVTIVSVVMATKVGWDRTRLRAFAIGCILHDIGKIFIEPAILNKPGKLTEKESAQFQAHPELGHGIIKAIAPGLGFLVPQVAYQHHERQDGSGYPRKLLGNDRLGVNAPKRIHDFGALSAVADVYDAMTSDRPYRRGWPSDHVCRHIRRGAGEQFNPEAVALFLKSVAPYPLATAVRVLNGKYAKHEGVVATVPEQAMDRPRVRLLFAPGGGRIQPVEIDLRVEKDVKIECVGSGPRSPHPAAANARA
jgi:HD-GYP domain-containing protein (c-di-GMP phosphodiesterase class II)